ncbi:MAG: type III-B CRISPR-associated protein Cas10/Cmr2 [Desulfurococcales archaeon]|nr:type III-B CRISPR-associated protein Cas10/Cmr2 [Desulfurococcales archaeon]
MNSVGYNHRLGILGLAVLFHDPPWKPWAIVPGGITGPGGSSGLEKIIRELERIDAKYVEGAREYLAALHYSDLKEHEKQGLFFTCYLASKLEEENNEVAKELAGFMREASQLLSGKDQGPVARADHLASALDRTFLELVSKFEDRSLKVSTPEFVNPFEPYKRLKGWNIVENNNGRLILPEKIPAKTIAFFMKNYAEELVKLSIKGCEKYPHSKAVCLLHYAFMILEPLWYLRTSRPEEDKLVVYVPPADTRIPTHTVFDHLNAALAILNWVPPYEEGLNGCLVKIDLAGVQSWIKESRRLRDLWASSWLASFLAWKSVERLVEKYGPGILVTPTARLNPFYSARIIGYYIDSGGELSSELWDPLGLPYKWPIDPTIPSTIYLALPREACPNGEFIEEETILSSYSNTWRELLYDAVNKAKPLLVDNIDEYVKELGPPLPIRITIVHMNEIYEKVSVNPELVKDIERILDGSVKTETIVKNLRDSLFYAEAFQELNSKEKDVVLNTTGRTSNVGIMRLEKELYNRGLHKKCLMCGKLTSILDQGKLKKPPSEIQDKFGQDEENLREIFNELKGEPLCPYCLVKRLLRYLLRNNPELFRKLVGLRPDANVLKDKLRWTTVDSFTSRSVIARKLFYFRLKELMDKNLESLHSAVKSIKQNNTLVSGLFEEKQILELIDYCKDKLGKTGIPEINCRELIRDIDAIALSFIHNEDLKIENRNNPFIKALEPLSKDTIPRKYMILQSDIDFMSSLLKGCIPLKSLLPHIPQTGKDFSPLTPIPPDVYIENVLPDEAHESQLAIDKLKQLMKLVSKSYVELSSENLCNPYGTVKTSFCDLQNKTESTSIPSVIFGPSYHFSITRSLALLSQMDRETVENAGGIVIYSGGDDFLGIAPPIALADYEIIIPQAIILGGELRSAYSGESLLKTQYGNNRQKYYYIDGFNILLTNNKASLIAPAITAYGRTTVAYFADSKTPLWLVLESTRELEETKDSIYSFTLESPSKCSCLNRKDALILASETRGVSLIPYTMFKCSNGNCIKDLKSSLKSLIELFDDIYGENSVLTYSFLRDYIMYKDLVERLAFKHLFPEKMLRRIVSNNLKKNTSNNVISSLQKHLDMLIEISPSNGRIEAGGFDYSSNGLYNYDRGQNILNSFGITQLIGGILVYSSSFPNNIRSLYK